MRTRWRDSSRPRSYLLLIHTPAGVVVGTSDRMERLEAGLHWVKRCGKGKRWTNMLGRGKGEM